MREKRRAGLAITALALAAATIGGLPGCSNENGGTGVPAARLAGPDASASPGRPSHAKSRRAGKAGALIAGADEGPDEPRHAADALMQYWLLRDRGLSDDQIVLALPAWAIGGGGQVPAIRSEPDGRDLRAGARPDLAISELDVARIPQLLQAGDAPARSYIYLSGHGDERGMELTRGGGRLRGQDLAAALDAMRARRPNATLTAVVDACEPDSFLNSLAGRPGATLLTASARGRPSFATEYDHEAGVWLADQFTSAITRTLADHPPRSARRLLRRVRRGVPDSQPQLAGNSDLTVDQLVPSDRGG